MSATLAIYTADASLLTAIKKFNTEMSKRRSAQSVAEFKAKGAERMRKLHGLYEKIREWKELKGVLIRKVIEKFEAGSQES